ncbi:hypothetical protein B7P43_G04291 [Cryptotermes secundus]|uniref:Uncharacterized protein n=1 Tax=Cryptotermes secundus TaxID=105785 RepID=A0A2J7QFY5_9NEOP|nr:hypothetical protein B7P43_G04291 [Cryptotermes secundus]
MLLLDSERMLPEPGFSTANYEGKVVESCASLGIYQLHDGVQLCLAFLMKHTDVPVPCVGQNVSVYNAHSWKNEADHKHHIVLCGRSSIIVHGQSQELTNSNCILTDINHSCTYNDLLWLKKQLVQVEEKFNSDFLTENGILR